MIKSGSAVQSNPPSTKELVDAEPNLMQEREESYLGVVNKCPNCGDTVKPFQTACESCGYVFQATQVSRSVKDLMDKIQSIHAAYNQKLKEEEMTPELEESFNKQIAKTIRDYVIPTDIEAIYDFMQLADLNVNNLSLACESLGTNSQKAIYEAWENKLEQAHDKALSTHSESIYMDTIESFYQKSLSGMNKRKRQAKSRSLLNIVVQNLLVVVGLLSAILAIVARMLHWHSAPILSLLPLVILIFPAWFLGRTDAGKEELLVVFVAGIGCIIIGFIADGLTHTEVGPMLQMSGLAVIIIGCYQTLKRMGLIKSQKAEGD